jgi:hypothetical protein
MLVNSRMGTCLMGTNGGSACAVSAHPVAHSLLDLWLARDAQACVPDAAPAPPPHGTASSGTDFIITLDIFTFTELRYFVLSY